MEHQAAAEGKAPPQHSEDGWGWGVMGACERHERLVSLCGVCCVQGPVGCAELDAVLCVLPSLLATTKSPFLF